MVPRVKDRVGESDSAQRLSAHDGYYTRMPSHRAVRDGGYETDHHAPDLGRNYKDLADTIAKAASTISELVKRNQMLRADAEAALANARAECGAEKERADKLQADLDVALSERARLVQDTERRLRDLAAGKQDLADRLEKTTADLDLANQWLEYLSSHVHAQLGEAIKKADGMFRNRSSAA